MAKNAASGTPALVALTRAGVSFTTHSYDHDPACANYGLEAAAALEVAPAQVFKTLLVCLDGQQSTLGVGIAPVDRQLDLKAVATALAAKRAAMAEPALAERVTGYVVGGISPFGQKKRLPMALDLSAGDYHVIYVSGGRRGLDVGISPDDLCELTSAIRAPIAR